MSIWQRDGAVLLLPGAAAGLAVDGQGHHQPRPRHHLRHRRRHRVLLLPPHLTCPSPPAWSGPEPARHPISTFGLYLAYDSSDVFGPLVEWSDSNSFCRLEKVDLRSARSFAKVTGTVVCLAGAMLMAFFKGPELLGALPLPAIDDDWVRGGIFLMGNACCFSVWYILQVVN